MARIVSVWLRAWPIARLLRTKVAATPSDLIDPRIPLVLVHAGSGGARVVALNRAAQRAGLTIGDLLSNARSKVLELQTRDADPRADREALDKLALWAMRYTPVVAPWEDDSGADGLFLDIEGCAHLFGGEDALLDELGARLRSFGLSARLAVADTAGASWAVARSIRAEATVIASGTEREALAPLPLASLRLSSGARSLLRRLGFRTISEIIDQPRAPFAARFEGELLRRLDQALGAYPEPLKAIAEPPVYRAHTMFLEPIFSQEHVIVAATRLLEPLCKDLTAAALGARTLRLILFRVDGGVQCVDIGIAAPNRDPAHIARIISLRLDRVDIGVESEFGFDAIALHIVVAEPLEARQTDFVMGEEQRTSDGLACLIDRLQHRLGSQAVYQLQAVESHIPERAHSAGTIDLCARKTRLPAPSSEYNQPSAPGRCSVGG
jgi:protein ImuB